MLIVLKNTPPDLFSEQASLIQQIFQQEVGADFSTSIFIDRFLDMSENPVKAEVVSLMREVLIIIAKHSETESSFILDKLIEICCLQAQDQQFTVTMIDLLAKRDAFM